MKVTEEDLIGGIANLPIEIVQHIIDNGYATLDKLQQKYFISAFAWIDTEEGHNFWSAIDDGKYKVFFDKYPKSKELVPVLELEGILMEVSDDERNWGERLVYGKTKHGYLASLSEKGTALCYWNYARPKTIKLTKQEIADKFNIDIDNLIIEL